MKQKKGSSENRAGHAGSATASFDQGHLAGSAVHAAAHKTAAARAAEKLLQRLSAGERATLAQELPDMFSEEHLLHIADNLNRHPAAPGHSAAQYIDEQIKTIAAYVRGREESFKQLPLLPREALRQLVMIRKYASTEEVMQLQDRIMNNLRKRFGPFDESALVMFLVKYLL